MLSRGVRHWQFCEALAKNGRNGNPFGLTGFFLLSHGNRVQLRTAEIFQFVNNTNDDTYSMQQRKRVPRYTCCLTLTIDADLLALPPSPKGPRTILPPSTLHITLPWKTQESAHVPRVSG